MSGRLIILPKKSYCPWNPKNVERVERDEREHREAQELAKKQQAKDVAQQRSLALRKKGGEDGKQLLQRFNLFEEEERTHMQNQHQELMVGTKEKKTSKIDHGRKSSSSKQNVAQQKGHFASCQPESTPFYMKIGTDDTTKPSLFLDRRQARRKRDMDPMKEFHPEGSDAKAPPSSQVKPHSEMGTTSRSSHRDSKSRKRSRREGDRKSDSVDNTGKDCKGDGDLSSVSSASSDSSTSRRKRHKRKYRHVKEKKKKKRKCSDSEQKKHSKRRHRSKDNDVVAEKAATSIDILRQRRAEREETERRRSQEILGSQAGSNTGHYLDQYHPHLSNR